jgi:hypothetical protein
MACGHDPLPTKQTTLSAPNTAAQIASTPPCVTRNRFATVRPNRKIQPPLNGLEPFFGSVYRPLHEQRPKDLQQIIRFLQFSGRSELKTTCLINNYNYQRYVGEAVESALCQTLPVEKVVVVDDGSDDDSIRYLRRTFGSDRRVAIIEKEHGGQLSCFNRGIREVNTELVFFLDADDRYQPQLP